jgi:phenylacetate-CoA ligase
MREQIYYYSPLAVQNWMITSYGRNLIRQRYGAEYRHALKYYLSKTYDSLAAEQDLQFRETKRLIAHAVAFSPFYKNLYSAIDTDDIRSLGDLRKLPIVDKEDLRKRIYDVYTVSQSESISAFTGGTTGKSLGVRYIPGDFQSRMAYLDAFKCRCGVDPARSVKATFSGRSFAKGFFQRSRKVFWRDNRAYKQRLYSTFDLLDENLPYYISNLNSLAPDVINGFVSAIYRIARFCLTSHTKFKFRPKAIFTTSETLLPFHRAAIESAFQSKVYNQYASAEGAPYITECSEGNLHYNIDTGVIEAIDFGFGPEMVVTSFTTYGTPLIRYRIGDRIAFQEGKCRCGHCHPLVKSIEGRKVDYLISKEKGMVSLSHLSDVVKGLPNCVKEMQFIQNDPSEIVLRLSVDDARFDSTARASILKEMELRFGKETQIAFEFVERIDREPSGKFALIKSRISGNAA